MSDGSVGDAELAQVQADHLGLDVHQVENLSVIHRNLHTKKSNDKEREREREGGL